MAYGNSTMLVGNLVADPELRFSASGTAMAKLRVAWHRQDANKQELTEYFNVVAWRSLAENVAQSLRKGMRVVVVGRQAYRSWETEDGEVRAAVEIEADDIGPSLRWATATVVKVRKEASVEGGGQVEDNGPWAAF